MVLLCELCVATYAESCRLSVVLPRGGVPGRVSWRSSCSVGRLSSVSVGRYHPPVVSSSV